MSPRFAPNLRWLFTELPLTERFGAVARAGFDAIEFSPHFDLDAKALKRQLDDHGLRVVTGLAVLDWANGDRGNAGIPGREPQFRDSIERSLEYAAECAMPYLHVPAGELPQGEEPARCRALYAKSLAWCAAQAKPLGVTIVFEPVCRARLPNFLLHTLAEGVEVIRAIGRDDVKLIFDTYHVQMEEGALSGRIEQYWPHIAYVQIGNPPGRHEPGAGELDLHYFIELVQKLGYEKHIGLEYLPSAKNTLASLAWIERYGVKPH